MYRISFVLLNILFLASQSFSQELKAYIDSARSISLTGDTMEVYYLTKAIQLAPDNPTLYELRAYAKSVIAMPDSMPQSKKFGPKAAILDFDEAIKKGEANPVLFEQRALNKAFIGDFAGAVSDMSKAIKIDKKNAKYYAKRGDYYWGLTNYSDAISDYNKAHKLDDSDMYSLRKTGDCWYELGYYSTAGFYYNKLIRTIEGKQKTDTLLQNKYNENLVLGYLYLANSDIHMGYLNDGIKGYTRVIGYNEKFQGVLDYTVEAYRFRGEAKIFLQDKTEGCKDLNKAVELGNDEEAKEFMAENCKK